MKNIVAIDPGVSGGIAWLNGCTSMPGTEHDLLGLLKDLAPEVVVMEDVPKFIGPKIPGARIAPLFENIGLCKGVCVALGTKLVMVKPNDWQSHFRLGTRKATGTHVQWKTKLKAEAQRRFPQVRVTLDTADALLIWEYARETNL